MNSKVRKVVVIVGITTLFGAAGTGGRPADRAATIAKQLGLSTAKVQAALQAVRQSHGPSPRQGTPPSGTAPQAGAASSSSGATSS